MRTLTLMAASLLLAACSTPEQHLVGGDRDSHGCIGSAGYQWSALTGKCVRLFEEGIRLNPTDASQTSSAFVLFNTDQTQAELHLPSGEQHLLTRQGAEGNWSWQGRGYTLFIWKGYVLKHGDKALYHGESPDRLISSRYPPNKMPTQESAFLYLTQQVIRHG